MRALRVLVIEDNALIGLDLADMLTDMGHDVCGIEATEPDAVASAARSHPDLMLVDAGLRLGNGLSAMKAILRAGFVAHIFMSGHVLPREEMSPRAVVLQKPFAADELRVAIGRALALTRPDAVA